MLVKKKYHALSPVVLHNSRPKDCDIFVIAPKTKELSMHIILLFLSAYRLKNCEVDACGYEHCRRQASWDRRIFMPRQ